MNKMDPLSSWELLGRLAREEMFDERHLKELCQEVL